MGTVTYFWLHWYLFLKGFCSWLLGEGMPFYPCQVWGLVLFLCGAVGLYHLERSPRPERWIFVCLLIQSLMWKKLFRCKLYEARTDSFVIILAYSGDVTKEIYVGFFHWCYYHSSNQNNFKFVYGISANINTQRTSWKFWQTLYNCFPWNTAYKSCWIDWMKEVVLIEWYFTISVCILIAEC